MKSLLLTLAKLPDPDDVERVQNIFHSFAARS